MRLLNIALCALLACITPVVRSEVTGFRTALTQDGLTFIANTAKEVMSTYFTSIKVPAINWHKHHFAGDVKNIECHDIKVENIKLQAHDGIKATINDLSLKCHADWKYKLHHWPHIPRGSGSVDVHASQGDMNVQIALNTDGHGHAHVNAKDVSVDIGHLSLKFHGGITSLILNLIKGLFGHEIRKSVENSIKSTIADMVNKDINLALQNVPTEARIKAKAPYNVSIAHLGLTSLPEANAHYVGAGLQGYISPIHHPNAIAPYSPPSLPGYDSALASSSYIQLIVSNFLVESAIWTYQTQGLLQRTLKSDKVPSKFPFKLNTNDPIWNTVAPGLVKKFPKNEKMDIKFYVGTGSKVTCSEKNSLFSMTLPVNIAVQVDEHSGAKDAFVLGCPLDTSLTVKIQNDPSSHTNPPGQVITGDVKYLRCELRQVKSEVGDVHFKLLKNAIDFAFTDILVPIANELLKAGMPVPVTEGLQLTSTRVHYGDGYATLGSKAKIDIKSLIPMIQKYSPTLHEAAEPVPIIYINDSEDGEKDDANVNEMLRGSLRA